MQEQKLFKEPKLRRKNGQYCTKEQYRQEMVDDENQRLRFERDKYYRMYLACAHRATRLERELITLKARIGELV